MARKSVRFRPTDGVTSLLTKMLRQYYQGRGGASRRQIRRVRTQLLVTIADGVARIPLKEVAARGRRTDG